MAQYAYYEDGCMDILNEFEVLNLFITQVDKEQKAQGTTLKSWLSEMIHMEILIPIESEV